MQKSGNQTNVDKKSENYKLTKNKMGALMFMIATLITYPISAKC
jgi:hypothetical protein